MRDLPRIADLLRASLPGGDAITGISPLTTGFSNETYRVDGADLILRLPPAAGAMLDGHDVVGQARIYAVLTDIPGAPPVPRVVSIGEDATAIGSPFFVMERVRGESIDDFAMQPWLIEGSDALRRQVCSDWIATFASLGNLPPLDVLGPVTTPEDDARMWQAFAGQAESPVLVGLFDRLLRVPAPRTGAPAVVHGDAKLSNLMWHKHRITAVLDWEMALNGEPLADLAYMLYAFESEFHAATRAPKLPGMLTRVEVIALWSLITGRSTEGLLWHEIAQFGKLGAIIAEGTNMHLSGRSDDPKLAHFARSLESYIGVMSAMLDGAGY